MRREEPFCQYFIVLKFHYPWRRSGSSHSFCQHRQKSRYQGIDGLPCTGLRPRIINGEKEDKMGDRASHIAEVLLGDVRAPVSNRLGNEGEGFKPDPALYCSNILLK